MKKILSAIMIFFISAVSVYGQPTAIAARSSKQNGGIRLVFEAEENFIKKTKVSISGTQMIVEFPSAFNISPQKGFDLEISIKDRLLTVDIKMPFEIKLLRLSSPSRLVVDITPKAAVDMKPRTEIAAPQKVFVLDAGHGGYDFGITSNDLKEKDISLTIVRDIESLLIKKDKKVFLTRKGDQFLSLKDRAIFANQKAPEIFLSIHVSLSGDFALYVPKVADAGAEPSAAELYGLGFRQKTYAQQSRKLAEALGKALKEEFNLNVVQREMSLPILNSIGAPAVLIEVPSFKILSYDQKTRARLAETIAKGFSYYGQQ